MPLQSAGLAVSADRSTNNSGHTSYPGASAETVAQHRWHTIEQAVNGIKNAIYMQSTSGSDGSYTLTVTFKIGTDLDTSLALVQNAVNSALPQLPQPVRDQGVNVKKVTTNILMIESLYSDDNRFGATYLSNYATINLVNPLSRLPASARSRSSAPAHIACVSGSIRQSSRPSA